MVSATKSKKAPPASDGNANAGKSTGNKNKGKGKGGKQKGKGKRKGKPMPFNAQATTVDAVCPTFSKYKFAQQIPISISNMYNPGAVTGARTTHTELGLHVTDFFDYSVYDAAAGGIPQTVTHYFWDVGQNLFNNGSQTPELDANLTVCRPRKIHVWVLPVKGFEIGVGTGPNNTNALGMFTVQAQVPGFMTRATDELLDSTYSCDNQVTNVLPQIDTFWKKVLTCDYNKTFQSGVLRPFFPPKFPTAMCCFSMAIIDSTDGGVYLPATDAIDLTIRVKVVLELDQPISTIQNAYLGVFKNETFDKPSTEQNGTVFDGPVLSYVQTDLRKVMNNFR